MTAKIINCVTGEIAAEGYDLVDAVACNSGRLANADLRRANFCGAKLCDIDFSGAFLERARFNGADMKGARFRDTDLSRACFRGAYASAVVFGGANLDGADFLGATLSFADFRGASLENTVFCGTRLYDANFSRCDLKCAIFDRAYLGQADFCNAKLNWHSHTLLAELLRRAARYDEEKLKAAGFVLVNTTRCWRDFLRIDDPLVGWALDVLAPYAVDDSHAPDLLRIRGGNIATERG